VRSLLGHEPQRLPALEHCSHVVAAPAGGARPDEWSWRFAPFENEPLAPGIYAEPFEPPPAETPSLTTTAVSEVMPAAFSGAKLAAAGGAAASVGGYWVFHAFGFTTEQYLAVVVLGWVLAAILAVASRNPNPPGPTSPL
jgi:hypothetical protein